MIPYQLTLPAVLNKHISFAETAARVYHTRGFVIMLMTAATDLMRVQKLAA